VPLIFEEDLLAIIVICRKKYGLEYSKDEMEILSLFGNEIAATLRRNQIIAQMRDKDNQRFRLERLAALGQLTAGLAMKFVIHLIQFPLQQKPFYKKMFQKKTKMSLSNSFLKKSIA